MWKPVPGFEDSYEVSDQGEVRSLTRWVRARTGRRKIEGQLLRPKVGRGGYRIVTLSREQRRSMFPVHVLVLTAFVGPRPPKMDGCHNNGDVPDNRLDNLRWDTRKNNHADKALHGTMARGDRVNTAKLKEEQVVRMRGERAAGASVVELAERYGVSTPAVSYICMGRNWRHVGGPLTPSGRPA